jgi:hypothetical protein
MQLSASDVDLPAVPPGHCSSIEQILLTFRDLGSN